MLPKFVIVCLAATAFVATTALMPTGASAARGNVPQPGTWNWRKVIAYHEAGHGLVARLLGGRPRAVSPRR